MKYSIISAALFAAVVSADAGCTTDGHNNWYCQEVTAISYTGVGSAASYNKVTNMNAANGQCSSTPFGYSGSLSPLNEEVCIQNSAAFATVRAPRNQSLMVVNFRFPCISVVH
jgi:hypothetical protein